MPFIFPHSQCCSTVPQLSSSISCPKFIYFLLVQLLPSHAGSTFSGCLPPVQVGGCVLLGLIFINAWTGQPGGNSGMALPCFPAELSHLFFPGSSCHLHQKVNLFLFPITAFITWKWLLWKVLIKHWLFPGWTETEHFSYSIAQEPVLCAAALGSVCMAVCEHRCFEEGQCCCCPCFSFQPFQQWLFWSWVNVADAASAGFLLHSAPAAGCCQQCWSREGCTAGCVRGDGNAVPVCT